MEAGVAVYACMMRGDSDQDAVWIAEKITSLRVFSDEDGKMNKSLLDTGGSCLVVSQFTLAADTKKGRRPSYMEAMGPPAAKKLVARLAGEIMALGANVQTGVFGADMQIELSCDGPVSIWLDSSTRK